jgi:hypothetical protein
VSSYSCNVRAGSHFPDGLDETAIDRLIAQVVAGEVEVAPEPTSALVDGSAAERRRRRMERRALAAVVRSLPTRQVSPQVGDAA